MDVGGIISGYVDICGEQGEHAGVGISIGKRVRELKLFHF